MRYFVKIYQYKGDYSAEVPDLPGCGAAAKSVERVQKIIAKGIALHVEMLQQSGEEVPAPRQEVQLSPDETVNVVFCTWVDVDIEQAVGSGR